MTFMHVTANFYTPLISLFSVPLKFRLFNVRSCSSFLHTADNFAHQIQNVFNVSYFCNSLINSSTQLTHLNQIHAQLIISGIHAEEPNLVSKFINSCFNLGYIGYARKMFDECPQPHVCMWSAMVEGYCRGSMWGELIELYARMQRAGVSSDCDVVARVLKACSWLSLVEMGGALHGHVIRLGCECDVFVQNGFVSLYAECGSIDDAKKVVTYGFLSGRRSTVFSWTAIISKHARNGRSIEALRLFNDMRMMSMKPDWITLVSVLRACADLDCLEQGKSLHGCVLKTGLESEEDLRISLAAMYAKCGQVVVARFLFDQMDEPNLILWNAMISGYAKNGYAEEAVELFKLLATKNIKPDSITVRAAILACSQVGSLDMAKWMSDYVNSVGHWNHVFVKTAIIDMYAKCGSLVLARQVFDCIFNKDKDVVVWSAMIVGYGIHGRGKEAIDLYVAMVQAQVRPNEVTFLGLLTACKNSCLVKEGWELFHSMKDYGLEPRNQHYACVVDLLGRAGYLGEAYKFIVRMPVKPGLSVWGALLSACRIHRHVQMGEYAAAQLFSIDPYDTGHYVQLSNLYAAARMWDQVNEVRKLMKERGLSKDFGYSLIEINGKLQVFRVGDNSHPKSEEIWKELADLERRLKEAGFSPDTESNLHDLSYEDMQYSLCNHSERLAIAYGLISTPSGSSLRIIKNLRACVNCHSAIKLISKFTNREIIVRDANRFHHFKDGVCSCGDYW